MRRGNTLIVDERKKTNFIRKGLPKFFDLKLEEIEDL